MGKNGGKLLSVLILVGFFTCSWAQTTPADPLEIIFFQGFVWQSWMSNNTWYNVLKGAAKEIADAGVTDVWFPPSSQSAADGPQGYLPEKLYDMDSKYGTSDELRQAVQAFHQNGVRCVADIVINHRMGSKQDDKGFPCIFEGGTADEKLDWGAWAVPTNDKPYSCGTGKEENPKDDFTGAPDIDHTNSRVQSELSEWMKWLMSDIGFNGWRFDFALGYPVNSLVQYVQNTSPDFSVSEVWEIGSFGNGGEHLENASTQRQGLVDWVHSASDRTTVFDFTTKGLLQYALKEKELWRLRDSNGKPSGMIGLLPEKAVTFIDNHDTGSSQQNTWPFPYDKITQGYLYILTHPGIPTIFYDHFQDNNFKENIKKFVEIRKRNKIKANSVCTILTAESDLYIANIDEKVIMKIGPKGDLGQFQPSDDFQLAASGEDYAVWERKA